MVSTLTHIHVPCHGLTLHLNGSVSVIRSTMRRPLPKTDAFEEVLDYIAECRRIDRFNTQVDALEALILAHAHAGLDVTQPGYVAGIEAAYAAIASH